MSAAAGQEFQLRETTGDLFACPETDSLAHCVSKDLHMGKGIASLFKSKFRRVDELMKQKKDVGDVAILEHDHRYVYYLITKPKYFHKPTYQTLEKSLQAMKSHCKENSVSSLAMPKIGCGLDKLEWNKVSALIKDVFKDLPITITVYTI